MLSFPCSQLEALGLGELVFLRHQLGWIGAEAAGGFDQVKRVYVIGAQMSARSPWTQGRYDDRMATSMLPDYCELDQVTGQDFYSLDPNISFILDRHLPDPQDRSFAEEHIARYGKLVGETLAERAEATDKHGPVLKRYDRWGQEICEIVHHPTWLESKADLVRNGFVGLPYHAGRPVPAVLTAGISYLVCQAETAIYCGLGMTSAAADIVERYAPNNIRDEYLRRLTSLDPDQAWEGGMFLTERQGGSDVGANTTQAVIDGDEWRIFGDKHFCSNVDADVFIVLARPTGAPPGSKGLATFIVPRHLPDGSSNGFHIKRLKPKLGTVGVPTGEVTLDGSIAWLAAQSPANNGRTASDEPRPVEMARDGKGINRMMEMVNGSRFGVALMGLGIHRRSFVEASVYAAKRTQFGNRIDSYPLVKESLVDLVVELEAGMALTFECASATRLASDPEDGRLLRRILIPLAKLRTTRAALTAASQALEIFGGNGYMEDWPMARQLRDAQCHTIWEGTENILCIDVRRAMRADHAEQALFRRVQRALDSAAGRKQLAKTVDLVASGLHDSRAAANYVMSAPEDMALLHVRRLAYLLADLAESALLMEEASWSLDRDGNARKAAVALRFASQRLSAPALRGITDPDRSVLDLFEPLIRYGFIEDGARELR
ncbi:MAG: acyl-CoA dehydrogenase family protein [Actinobacteria bacterium]|nr:acyl-CoA dehydrogenase family protein [Actinomycetota bacterium]